jgi:tetratricopeptide (TPR) repeat protein
VINRSLNNPDYSPIFTIGTLSRAFFISINLKYSDHARNISAPMVNFYKQKEMYVEIYQTKEKVFKLLTSEKKDIAALGEAMDTLAIAREIRDVQGVNNWLPAVLELAKKRRLKLPEAIKVRLLYEQAKVAELLGNKKEYENLIIQAHAASNHVDDNDLTSFISFEMAQLALHSNSPAQAGEHLDEVEDNLLKGNSAIYRARAQAMMMEGDLDEARHLLQRAITLSKKEKNEIGKAMNISLMGEIEGKLGNREKAVKLFEQAVSIFEKAGDRHNAGVTYHQWAKLYYTEGLMEEAGEYFIHAALCFRDTGDSYTLEVVSSNFNYYLAELTDEGASFMFIKWKAAQLPDLMDIN